MECELENITIYYEVFGEGRPILMLHGRPTDHRHMVSDLEPIFKNRDGWKRIYPDFPGMGKTPGREWITHEDHVLDVTLDFIDHVIPGRRFVVAGTSYGAYVARGVVYRRSAWMDGLLMTVPVIVRKSAERTRPPDITLVKIAGLAPDEARDLEGLAVVQSRKQLERLRTDVFPAIEIADHKFLDRLGHEGFSFDVDNPPEPFDKPTLILMGRQDSNVGYRDAWSILENYTRGSFVVLDRAGHGLVVEQEDLFQALVNEWLDRVEESFG